MCNIGRIAFNARFSSIFVVCFVWKKKFWRNINFLVERISCLGGLAHVEHAVCLWNHCEKNDRNEIARSLSFGM